MNLKNYLDLLNNDPDRLEFSDSIDVIDAMYDFNPVAFHNGDVENAPGENNGSCKLFAFAQLQGFDEQQTLNCFGAYYRDDVLNNPDGDDHQNIRNFIKTGWSGIRFTDTALTKKR
jgi:hypothetical protein